MRNVCKVLEFNPATGKSVCLLSGSDVSLLDAHLITKRWKTESADCYFLFLDGATILKKGCDGVWNRLPIEEKRVVMKAIGWY